MDETNRTEVRSWLRENGIKLWLSPYTNGDGSGNETELVRLAERANVNLKMSLSTIIELLESLRQYSWQKLLEKEKNEPKPTRTILVRLRFARTVSEQSNELVVNVPIREKFSGKEFKSFLTSSLANQPDVNITENSKIILNGKTIQDNTEVSDLVKSLNSISVLVISGGSDASNGGVNPSLEVEKVRKAALLATQKDKYQRMTLEDQDGRPIHLPPSQSQNLIVAMMIHEKGRAALKRNDYVLSLAFFLEADLLFSELMTENPTLMKNVDNHALLQLDIVWTYFQLKQLSMLQDAEMRLERCRTFLEQSHGTNLERLIAIRSTTPPELACYVRLNLMQAVIAYHSGWIPVCGDKLRQAENMIQRLQVDENKLNQLAILGFNEQEARVALRLHNGDMDQAISQILQKREELKQKNENWKRQRKWGLTKAGKPIEIEGVNFLTAAGVDETVAVAALRKTENDVDRAFEMIQQQPEELFDYQPEKKKVKKEESNTNVSEEALATVLSMGYEFEEAKQALINNEGDAEKAINYLLETKNFDKDQNTNSTNNTPNNHNNNNAPHNNNNNNNDNNNNNNNPITSSSSMDDDDDEDDEDENDAEEIRSVENALADINPDAFDYLNLTLVDEMNILKEYQLLCTISASQTRQ